MTGSRVAQDLTGKRFGLLKVLRKSSVRSKSNGIQWECICDCGIERLASTTALTVTNLRSCGCLTIRCPPRKQHGMTGTRIYRTHKHMMNRCLNPKVQSYPLYGGRGIKVCKEWWDFIVFYEWAMENGYEDHLSIDRIDNEKDYCPENCKWSTPAEQSQNRRSTILTMEKALEIKRLYKEGKGATELGKMFGISSSLAGMTARNKIWKV